MRIFLIGYMGSGKSKTGEALARMMGYKAVDTDVLIEQQTGRTISDIFKVPGPDAFRDLEKKVLMELGKEEDIVVSTGGGLPCYNNTMDWMNANGMTVYLEANAGLLFHRLVRNKAGRPLIENLSDVELMEQINNQLVQRLPFYQQAKLKVNAASMDVKVLAEKIRTFEKK